jgi:hypothetical protein
MYKLDLSDENNPVLYGPFTLPRPTGYVSVSKYSYRLFDEHYYYELAQFENVDGSEPYYILVWDLGNPTDTPVLISVTEVAPDGLVDVADAFVIVDGFLIIPAQAADEGPPFFDLNGSLVFDYTDPANPQFIQYEKAGGGEDIQGYYHLWGDYFVLDESFYEIILDFSHLPAISSIGSVNLENDDYYIVAADPTRKLAYAWTSVPHPSSGPVVLDTSDLSQFKVVGVAENIGDEDSICTDVDVDENCIAYCAWGSTGIVTVDVSDPNHPVEPLILDTPGISTSLIQIDGVVYVADLNNGLVITDYRDLANAEIVNTIAVEGQAFWVDASGNHLFVGRDFRDILIFDITDQLYPVQIGEISFPGQEIEYFVVDGNRLIARSYSFIADYNISDVYNIPPPTYYNAGPNGGVIGTAINNGIVMYDQDLHLALRNLNEHSMSDPPDIVTNYDTGAYAIYEPYGFSYTFPYIDWSKLIIFDISDTSNPVTVGLVPNLWGDGLQGPPVMHGNSMVLATGGNGMEIIRLW